MGEDEFALHPDDDWYRPHALVMKDGSVVFTMSCSTLGQLFEAVTLYYTRTVEGIRSGVGADITGPVRFVINPGTLPKTAGGEEALAACLAECRAMASYGGEPVELVAEWGEL